MQNGLSLSEKPQTSLAGSGNRGVFKPGPDPRRGRGPKPGQTPFADIIRRRGDETQKDGRTLREHIMDAVEAQAKHGVEWAVKLIIERTEGKVKETIDLNHSTPELRQLADDELARIAAGD